MKPTHDHQPKSPAHGTDELSDAAESRFVRLGRWIADHPKSMIALALLLFLAMLGMGANQVAESRLTRMIAAIKAKGEPTTVEDLAAAMPHIPDEENMVEQLEKQASAISNTTISTSQPVNVPLIGISPPNTPPTGCRFPPDQLEATKAYLAQVSKELAGVHAALKLPRGAIRVKWTSPLKNLQLLPSPDHLHDTANALCLESIIACENGDAEGAGESLLDTIHLSDGFRHAPFLISHITKWAIIDLTCDQTERAINICGLPDALLERLDNRLESIEKDSRDYKQVLITERVSLLDTAKCSRNGKINPATLIGGAITTTRVFSAWRSLAVLRSLDTAEGLNFYNASIAATGAPDGQTYRAICAAESKFGYGALPWYAVSSYIMIPCLSRSAYLWIRSVAKVRALRAAIACERFRLANGRWPAKLDDLVPKYLNRIPIDPFGGKPIRYKTIPEGMVVYSLDRNEIDNGGDVHRLNESRHYRFPYEESPDTGWILVNPELRGRPAPTPAKAKTTTTTSAPN